MLRFSRAISVLKSLSKSLSAEQYRALGDKVSDQKFTDRFAKDSSFQARRMKLVTDVYSNCIGYQIKWPMCLGIWEHVAKNLVREEASGTESSLRTTFSPAAGAAVYFWQNQFKGSGTARIPRCRSFVGRPVFVLTGYQCGRLLLVLVAPLKYSNEYSPHYEKQYFWGEDVHSHN